jgi:uncharacterized protein YndB with AHSA1/START domain
MDTQPMTTFHASRDIPASPKAVFAAIKDPLRLARWWGPDGFTNTFHTFEFIPGGSWDFVMHGPDGADFPSQATFVEIVQGSLVRIRHTSQPHFELSIILEPSPQGTLVSWVQTFENQEVAAALRPIVEPANEQNLARLALDVGRNGQGGA